MAAVGPHVPGPDGPYPPAHRAIGDDVPGYGLYQCPTDTLRPVGMLGDSMGAIR